MRRRNEQQVERGIEGHTLHHRHECSILQKGRVEGDEGMVLVVGIASQVWFDRLWLGLQDRRKTAHSYALRERSQGRQRRHVPPVHKDQLGTSHLSEHDRAEPVLRYPVTLKGRERKWNFRKRGSVSILPLLLPHRRES